MKLILAAVAVGVMLVGCGEGSGNESYAGVPMDERTCVEAYKLPVNVGRCVQEESRH